MVQAQCPRGMLEPEDACSSPSLRKPTALGTAPTGDEEGRLHTQRRVQHSGSGCPGRIQPRVPGWARMHPDLLAGSRRNQLRARITPRCPQGTPLHCQALSSSAQKPGLRPAPRPSLETLLPPGPYSLTLSESGALGVHPPPPPRCAVCAACLPSALPPLGTSH